MSILVAGIGNIFFGDDAFGCEVARELVLRPLPEGVKVVDYGIRSYDLAYAVMDNHDATILVDAVPRGEPPGTLYLIELDLENPGLVGQAVPDAHSMNPVSVLEMVKSMGGTARQLYLVGCEPSVLESEEGQLGLSKIVQAAVPRAVARIELLLADLLLNKKPASPPPPTLTGLAKK